MLGFRDKRFTVPLSSSFDTRVLHAFGIYHSTFVLASNCAFATVVMLYLFDKRLLHAVELDVGGASIELVDRESYMMLQFHLETSTTMKSSKLHPIEYSFSILTLAS